MKIKPHLKLLLSKTFFLELWLLSRCRRNQLDTSTDAESSSSLVNHSLSISLSSTLTLLLLLLLLTYLYLSLTYKFSHIHNHIPFILLSHTLSKNDLFYLLRLTSLLPINFVSLSRLSSTLPLPVVLSTEEF